MASYATPADMLKRFDARTIGDLVGDAGTRVSSGSLATDPNLLALLASASGRIDAALLAGGQYSAEDLEDLTENSQAHLVQITCEIAMAYVFARRPLYNLEQYRAALELAESRLEAIRRGQNVFGIAANIEAGKPSIDGPTTVEYQNLNLVRDRTRNFYPARRNPNDR